MSDPLTYHQNRSAKLAYRVGMLEQACKDGAREVSRLRGLPKVEIYDRLDKIAADLSSVAANALALACQTYPCEVPA